MPDNRPVDRLQAFLAAIAGDESAPELTPRDQMEYYLSKMAERIGNINPSPTFAAYKMQGSGGLTMRLDLPFTPDFILAIDTYRFTQDNFGANSDIPLTIYDATGGSMVTSLYSATAGNLHFNVVSYADGLLRSGLSGNKAYNIGHTFIIIAGQASSANLYVKDIVAESSGDSLSTDCPFDPAFMIAYDASIAESMPTATYIDVCRLYANADLGTMRASNASNAANYYIYGGALTEAHSRDSIPLKHVAGRKYRIVCLQEFPA